MTDTRVSGTRVAFLGLGAMGRPMAHNVLKAGYPLTVWNRTSARANELRAAGARVADSPRAAAEGADVTITVLTDAEATEAVALGDDGLIGGLRAGATYVDMSTVTPEASRRIGAATLARGAQFLDAPVVGTIGPASQGTLTILVGGDDATFAAQRDLLGTMGSTIVHAGPIGQGTWLKLLVNAMLGVSMQAFFEIAALGQRAGFERRWLIEMLASLPVASGALQRKAPSVVARDFAPQFTLDLIHKDFRQLLEAAGELGVASPLATVTYGMLGQARHGGRGGQDYSVAALQAEELANVALPREESGTTVT